MLEKEVIAMSKRSDDYVLKLIPTRVQEDFTAKLTTMRAGYGTVADQMVALE